MTTKPPFSLKQLSPQERLRLLRKAEEGLAPPPAPERAGIQPISRGEPVPASFAQERMWFLATRTPGAAAAYHVPVGLRLRGALDTAALRAAFTRVVARHEALRTRFAEIDGRLVQLVDPGADGFALVAQDLRGDAEAASQVARLAAEEAARAFDLETGSPIRARLLRLSEDDHLLLVTLHHIVSDAWSMGVLVRELCAAYGAARSGTSDGLAPLAIQYPDFAAWQRERPAGDALAAEADYWRRTLAGAPALLALPTDRPRPALQSHAGDVVRIALGTELAAQVLHLGQRHGTTPFMTLLAGWAALLARLSGQDDLVIGTPTANRTHAEIEPLVGLFVNTLALRIDVAGDISVATLLQRVKAAARGSQQHQALPFEQVVEIVRPERSLSHTPLFQVMFAWQDATVGAIGFEGLAAEPVQPAYDIAKFDLSLSLSRDGGDIIAELAYATALFDRATAGRFAGFYRNVLQAMVGDAEQSLAGVPLVTADERARLVAQWRQPPARNRRDRCIHELFEAQAERRPSAVAVVQGDERVSYAELDARANRLAQSLRRWGTGPDTRIAVCMAPGIARVAALLAVWKAGSAYVPLDPAHPADRLAWMIEDSAPALVLMQGRLGEGARRALASAGRTLIDVDDLAAGRSGDARDVRPAATGVTPAHLAYVIYTSGSTGRPKGVLVEHRNLASLIAWHVEAFALAAGDRASSVAGFGFDAAVWETWPPLCVGATLVLPPAAAAAEPGALLDWWAAEPLAVSFLPTPIAELAFATGRLNRGLRHLLVGGDRLRHVPAGLPFALVNNYGPTENTVVATSGTVAAGDAVVHIGRAIGDTRVYVLDARREPAPPGVVGEIHIGGAQVARGYLNQPELTAERFVPDPFDERPGARMYRSGDLARQRADGNLEFLGRNDAQVKIRGVRIEPGEIEAQLLRLPGVREAVVEPRPDGAGGAMLVAWCSFVAGAAVSAEQLRAGLADRLPDYMIPAAFVRLEAMPLTANGKIDRRALPAPDAAARASRAWEAPVGPTEATLAAIWAELLHVEHVGRHDNFFELGGHSLLVMKLEARMRRHGLRVDVGLLFGSATLAQLAERAAADAPVVDVPPNLIPAGCTRITPALLPLVRLEQAHVDAIVDGVPGGAANVQDITPLLPLQEGILFHHLLGGEGDPYLLHAVMRFDTRARVDDYARSLQAVIARHDILRTSVAWENLPEPVQVVWRRATLAVEEVVLDARGAPAIDQLRALADPRRQRLDVRRAPLLRTLVARDPARGDWLMLQLYHHLCLDHTALEVVHHEVQAFLARREGELPPPLPFRDFVVQARHAVPASEHEAFFGEMLGDVDTPTLPLPNVAGGADGQRIAEHRRPLDAALAARLRAVARAHGVTPAGVCHLAWAKVLGRLTARDDVVFGTVLFGRLGGGAGVDRVPGLFINTLPLRLRLGDESVREATLRAQSALAGLLRHEHAPLALAQRCSRVAAPQPLFGALLNFRHSPPPAPASHRPDAWRGIEVLHVEERSNYPLALSVDDLGEGFSLTAQAVAGDPARVCDFMQTALERLVTALERAPGTSLRAIDAMPDDERRRLLVDWNATAVAPVGPDVVHERVRTQARQRPDAVAVVQGDHHVSYAGLDARSDRLARRLRALGVTPGARVALCMSLGVDLVCAMLAAVKAGAAYVPLDPAYPAERIARILADCAPAAVLTRSRHAAALPGTAAPVVVLDDAAAVLAGEDDAPLAPVRGEDLAYVIYTSGSTGEPNGVMVEHRNLANLVRWHVRRFELAPGRRTAAMAGVGFDASTWEIWPALCSGGTLLLPPDAAEDVESRLLWWQCQEADVGFVVTSLLGAAAEQGRLNAGLTHLLAGGDRLLRVPPLESGQIFVNNYGPTEATVVATSGALVPGDPVLHIGRPIANTRVYLLDRHGEPVPVGVAGELVIGGAGVARGYLNRPELTAERFVPDPFHGGRMYRTGDLARWLPDGNIEFCGRDDFQVKLRGVRIELGEIEAALARQDGVGQAVVLLLEDAPGEPRLVAYVTARDEGAALDVAVLRAAAASSLPEHLVPAAFVRLARLPLTPNGKIDRAALPRPDADAFATRAWVAPEGEIEEALAALWSELLQVDRVGRHDDFFALGGHSLSAMKLVSRLRQDAGVDIALQDLFGASSFAALADRILDARLAQFGAEELQAGVASLKR